jgi:hypothetical protein
MRVDDRRPFVFRTHDGGRTWDATTAGIPDDEPVNAVRADPVRAGLLFAGTEKAVYVSFDDGAHWQSLQQNLPHTSMRDLWIEDDALVVATHGRSFWVLDQISPLRQLTPEVASSRAHLFAPAAAYRVIRSTYPDTPYPPDEPMAANPPDGAVVDYYLGREAAGPVTLEILDSAGALVRRYRSDDAPQPSAAELQQQLVPPYWVRPSRNPGTGAGMHRFVWDLRDTPPVSARHGYPISAVPHDTPRGPEGVRVLPGTYMVRLTVDGATLDASLTVVMDPRVKTPESALRAQHDALERLSSLLSEGSRALRQARSVKEQLQALEGRATGATAAAVRILEKDVSALIEPETSGSTPAPATSLRDVVGRTLALYGSLGQADAGPTAAQATAVAALSQSLPDLVRRWQAIVGRRVPALNRRLEKGRLPPLGLQAAPAREEEGLNRDEG